MRKLKRAQILLAAEAGVSDEAIASSVSVGASTVSPGPSDASWKAIWSWHSVRRRAQGCRASCLVRKRRYWWRPPPVPVRRRDASAGHIDLLAGAMVRLTAHEGLSRETVRRRLAEDDLKPWRRDMWCIPEVDGGYVARMEDVLDLYAEELDPSHPVVFINWKPNPVDWPDARTNPCSTRSARAV